MSIPTYVTKNLTTASSTSIGSISTAAGGTVTLSCAILDTARRITVTSASLSGGTLTVIGLNQAGNVISEVITPSTTVGSAATTTQDFIKVTSVLLSCSLTNSSGGLLIGTTTQGGTPWYSVDTVPNPTALSFQIGITSASTVVAASFEYTLDSPQYNNQTNTWPGANPTTGPRVSISSLGSTLTSTNTIGLISFPITAWRITATSSSSSAGSVLATVLQSGN